MKRYTLLGCLPILAIGYVIVRIYWPFGIYQCQPSHKYIFLGDSITRGTVGDSYVNYLGISNYCNTSQNGQTLEGVHKTLLGLKFGLGQKIVLMIGGNDARLEISQTIFNETLIAIINQVKQNNADLLIITPPFVNEAIDTPTNQRLLLFISLMRNVAKEMDVQFVDTGTIGMVPQGVIDNLIHLHPSFINSLYRYLFLMDWDDIASNHDMSEYVDRFHLSGRGAKLLANRIKESVPNYFQ